MEFQFLLADLVKRHMGWRKVLYGLDIGSRSVRTALENSLHETPVRARSLMVRRQGSPLTRQIPSSK